MSDEMRTELRSFILRTFLIGEAADSLHDSTPLITSGIITSLAMLDLVSHLETTYRVTIPHDQLSAHKLDSVDRIVEMITELRRAGG
jgi:acyl carrier protein